MVSLSAHDDHRIYTRDRYAVLHQRILHGSFFLFLAFCVISFASFTCFSHPPSLTSRPNSFSFRMFYILAGFAFFSSLSGLLVAASQAISAATTLPHLSPLASIDEEIAAQRQCLAADLPRTTYGVIFLTFAVFFFAGAFVFAGLTTQQEVKSLRLAVIVPIAVGGVVFLQALVLTLREIFLVWFRISEFDVHLWNAIKKETLFGLIVTKYCTILARKREGIAEELRADHVTLPV